MYRKTGEKKCVHPKQMCSIQCHVWIGQITQRNFFDIIKRNLANNIEPYCILYCMYTFFQCSSPMKTAYLSICLFMASLHLHLFLEHLWHVTALIESTKKTYLITGPLSISSVLLMYYSCICSLISQWQIYNGTPGIKIYLLKSINILPKPCRMYCGIVRMQETL